jgi:hypothetical protein
VDTWQGSGTWQTSGPDLGPLIAMAVAAFVAAAAYAVVSWARHVVVARARCGGRLRHHAGHDRALADPVVV